MKPRDRISEALRAPPCKRNRPHITTAIFDDARVSERPAIGRNRGHPVAQPRRRKRNLPARAGLDRNLKQCDFLPGFADAVRHQQV